MAYEVDVVYFRRRLAILARGLHSRFLELESKDFPNKTPLHLINSIRQVIEAALEKIENADEKLLHIFFYLICNYQGWLKYLDNAHKEQTPRGLVVVLEGLLKELSPNAPFYAVPQFEYNYSIATFTPAKLLSLDHFLNKDEISALPEISRNDLHLIMFPRAERDNILVHAVFGHEIGHLIASRFLSDEEKTSDFATALGKASAELLSRCPVPSGSNQIEELKYKNLLQQNLVKIRFRAMEELISDYVGTLLFGPSALFASYEIFALDDLDKVPEGEELYPPSRYRLRFILDTLKEEGFADCIETFFQEHQQKDQNYFFSANELIKRIGQMTSKTEDIEALEKDAAHEIAYEWVHQSLAKAKISIKQSLPAGIAYTADSFTKEMVELLERLSLNVPPNELGFFPKTRTPKWQSALNASWIFRLHGMRRSLSGPQPFASADYDAINRLCLLAIENIALQREYTAHMQP